MPLKNIVVKNYTIVYDPVDTGEKRVPDELQTLVNEIYHKAQKGKPSIKKKLDKLLRRYPEVPGLWNHLTTWYEATGDMERAKQVNDELFKRFPNYLFGIVNKAVFETLDGNFEEAYRLLGNGELDISALYPERKTFHITEVTAYINAAVHYLAASGQFDEAQAYIEKIKKEDFSRDFVWQQETTVRMHYEQLRAKRWREVEEKEAIERTEPDTPQQEALLTPQNTKYQYLYEGDDWRLDTDRLATDLREDAEGLMAELHYIMRRAKEVMVYTHDEYDQTPAVLHAALILAYADPQKNFELFLQLLREPAEYVDSYLGDWDIDIIAVYCSHPSDQLLKEVKAFISEPLVPVIFKNALLESLKIIVATDAGYLLKIISMLEALMIAFREQKDNPELMDSGVLAFMVSAAVDIKATSLLPLIEELYAAQLVSYTVKGDFEEVRKAMMEKDDPGPHTIYANAIEHIKALSSGRNNPGYEDFEDDFEDDLNENYRDSRIPFTRSAPDASNNYAGTSLNAPCPCGSGKKYKRCHGKPELL